MQYPSYLIHFNRNHSSKNGQFTSGDGDGDGTRNDHSHRTVDERKISNRQYRNASKLFDVQRSMIKTTPTKGAVTNRHSSYEDRDVDEAKLSKKQYDNASKTFDMKRSVVTGKVTNRGSSFANDHSGKTDWDVDGQKLSQDEEVKETMRRNFGYTMADLTSEDEEEKKKKKKRITQSHWGESHKTV